MLDKKIAQKIANEVMNTLGYNINVMNEKGIIIGSGSKERIGTFHETAMFAIQKGIPCEVTEEETTKFQGVREGINLPIVDRRGKVIGVVGITGDPNEVRNIGKLVKMTAELIIEQQETMNRFYSHRNDKAIFLNTLINEQKTLSEEEIISWGERIGYSMKSYRIALILSFDSQSKETEKGFLEKILNRIKASDNHLKDDISSVMSSGFILIFKTLKKIEAWEIEKSINLYLEEILNDTEINDLKSFVGGYYKGIRGYVKSYDDACRMYKNGVREKDQRVYFTHHHYLGKLYDQLDEEVYSLTIGPYMKKIQKHFGKGTDDAMMTIAKILEYHFQFEQVAKALFIHKNTVIFRKKKMEDCLGFSFKSKGNDNLLFMLIFNYYKQEKRLNK